MSNEEVRQEVDREYENITPMAKRHLEFIIRTYSGMADIFERDVNFQAVRLIAVLSYEAGRSDEKESREISATRTMLKLMQIEMSMRSKIYSGIARRDVRQKMIT